MFKTVLARKYRFRLPRNLTRSLFVEWQGHGAQEPVFWVPKHVEPTMEQQWPSWVQGGIPSTGLRAGPRTWTDSVWLLPPRQALSHFLREFHNSRWPLVAEAGMSGRSVQPSSPQQETSVQQQGQQHNRWWQRCEQVAAFQQQRGRLPRTAAGRSSPFLVGEQGLGKWVVRQRQRYKAQKLSAERVAALETLPGFCWLEFARKPWEQQRQLVEAFYRQHGRLPRRIAEQSASFLPGEGPLGAWIMRQRSQGRGRMQPPLSAEHVAALDRTPGWSWGEFKIEPWESRCQQLQTFVRQHGRLPRYTAGKSSPFLHAEKGLGNWVRNQRQQYKARKLSAEQIAALEATPGWCWAEWSQQAWESRLQQVHSFVLEHGRLPRQQGSKGMPLQPREKALGSWCNQQR